MSDSDNDYANDPNRLEVNFSLEKIEELVNILICAIGKRTPTNEVVTAAGCFLIIACQKLGVDPVDATIQVKRFLDENVKLEVSYYQ